MTVYVYDNDSTDRTAEVAEAAGAEVRCEPLRGKGNVIRRAMADLDADVYLMIDGDDTYDASAAPEMVRMLLEGPYDQVTGVRVASGTAPTGPATSWATRVFNRVVSVIFRRPVNDMLSGYRVFSRRFVKSFPAVSRAFEIETELTVHAINTRVPQAEVPVGFKDRAEGSASKLRTYHDGFRIMRMITRLLHHERPLALYSTISALIVLVAVGISIPVIAEYVETGLVGRFPTAILSASLVILAFIILVVGHPARRAAQGAPGDHPDRLHGHPSPAVPAPQRSRPARDSGIRDRCPADRQSVTEVRRSRQPTRSRRSGRALERQRHRRRVRRRTRARGVPVVDP